MVKTIAIVYIPECKVCQVINEYMEYLNDKKYINYKKIHAIKNILKYNLVSNKLQNIKLQTPMLYLIENDVIINLNTKPFLEEAIRYKNSLVNKKETNNYFLNKIMRNE